MNDEAESSGAATRHEYIPTSEAEAEADADGDLELRDHGPIADEQEEAKERERTENQRRADAKRKRVSFFDHLLRELDTLVYLELVTLYYIDCSFFWFLARTLIHLTLLTPLPDLALARQHDEYKPFLPLILFPFIINSLLHLLHPAPAAGEDTRGYLHGGLMIDFVGQRGPTSKWKLVGMDVSILVLQLVMLSVYAKRRDLKKRLAKTASGETRDSETPTEAEGHAEYNIGQQANATREQDPDSEERGVLRRTDTLSDIGADQNEEDALLPSSSDIGHVDALDVLASGQCVIGDLHIVDTLLQEHQNYTTYRQTRSDAAANTPLSPSALRQLHNIRVRFGVGGG